VCMITGQLIFRNTGGQVPNGDVSIPQQNRSIFMVVGLIAVPDVCEYKGEYQYVVTGSSKGDQLQIHHPGIDRTKEIRSMCADGMLTHQIWRF